MESACQYTKYLKMCANVDQMCDKMCPIVWQQKDQCYQPKEKPNINDILQTLGQSSRRTAWAIPPTPVVYDWRLPDFTTYDSLEKISQKPKAAQILITWQQ